MCASNQIRFLKYRKSMLCVAGPHYESCERRMRLCTHRSLGDQRWRLIYLQKIIVDKATVFWEQKPVQVHLRSADGRQGQVGAIATAQDKQHHADEEGQVVMFTDTVIDPVKQSTCINEEQIIYNRFGRYRWFVYMITLLLREASWSLYSIIALWDTRTPPKRHLYC